MSGNTVAALSAPTKYSFMKAVRPFSLSVALVTCGLGITLAWSHGYGNFFRAVLVLLAGILLQSAANLYNDHADLSLWDEHDKAFEIALIRRNTRVALLMTLVAIMMGLTLVWLAGWPLLLIGLAGVIGGYSYTGAPVAYKNRGLGIFGIFLFTGVLMVVGSYMAVSGQWSNQVVLFSIPVSLISSMLLLANELRDVEDDKKNNIQTFTVRAGTTIAGHCYKLFGFGALVFVWGLGFAGLLSTPWLTVLPLLALKKPVALLDNTLEENRSQLVRLPPLTGRYFMIFGICMMLAV